VRSDLDFSILGLPAGATNRCHCLAFGSSIGHAFRETEAVSTLYLKLILSISVDTSDLSLAALATISSVLTQKALAVWPLRHSFNLKNLPDSNDRPKFHFLHTIAGCFRLMFQSSGSFLRPLVMYVP
jgi:hypothetical protein